MSTAAPQIDTAIEIVAPENISFSFQLAGPFTRIPAYAIDLLIRLLILLGVVVVAIGMAGVSEGMAFGIFLVGLFLLEWFYAGVFEATMNGQTPGKRIFNLRVVTVEGLPIRAWQAYLRNILRFADWMPVIPMVLVYPAIAENQFLALLMPIFPSCLVGLVLTTTTRRMQRAGDLVAGTMVVVEQPEWSAALVRLKDPPVLALAARLPRDFRPNRSLSRALSSYVERRKQLHPARLAEIARHIGKPLEEKLGLPAQTSHDLLLCALYYRTFVGEEARGKA